MAETNSPDEATGSAVPRVYRPRRVTLGRGLCYGLVDLMGGGWNNIVSGLLLYFFVTYGGVTAVEAGAILFIARIVDACVSLLLGPLTDGFYRNRLGRRFGRRHFFLLIGAPLVLLIFPLLWISGQGFWYYLVVYLAVEIIVAMILIPWETLPTEMTGDYTGRTKLSSMRMFLSATGTFLVFFIPASIKGSGNPHAYLITGLIFSILFAAAVSVTYFTTWERALTDEFVAELESEPRLTPLQRVKKEIIGFGQTFTNTSFVKHLAVYLLSFTGKDVFSSALTFYVVYAVSGTESFGLMLQALSIVGIPATLAAGYLMAKKGPRFLWAISFSVIIASLLALGGIYLLQPGSAMAMLIIVSIAYQIGRSILEFTPWNVYPFIPDVDKIMSRQDRAGIYAAVMTFGRKSTGAVATLLVSWALDLGGFVKPGTPGGTQMDQSCEQACPLVQSDAAITTIVLVTVFLPMVLIATALIISRFIYLDPHTHEILQVEIERLEEGGSKEGVTPEAKEVAEKLTGRSYERLWPAEESPRDAPVSDGRA